jgi:nucleotide-binding universal stress UspA family protein/mono/diheme cytochrome c family protein
MAVLAWPDGRTAGAAEPRSPLLMLHVSGGAAGYLESCGCGRNPRGGLPRRAAHLDQAKQTLSATRHFALEIGNFAASDDPEGRLKTLGAIDAMNRLEYVASGMSERELQRDRVQIRKLLDEAEFPFVSANLVKASTGQPWLPTSVIITVGDVDVGVTAVTRRNSELVVPFEGDWITTRDPVQALRRHVRDLERRCDLLMVLAAMPVDEARRAARENPAIDLIVGSHGSFQTGRVLREGRTEILYVGELGTHLGEVRVFRDGAGNLSVDARTLVLGPSLAPDRDMASRMREVLRRAREARLRDQASRRRSAGDRRFVGSSVCAECHASIVREWADSPHARAFQVLREGHDHVRTQCVSCHVTGFEQPGGFLDESTTAELANVGCEACHGPGAQHLEQPHRAYGEVTLQTCVTCHTSEMDPDFNYYRQRPEVAHRSVLGGE